MRIIAAATTAVIIVVIIIIVRIIVIVIVIIIIVVVIIIIAPESCGNKSRPIQRGDWKKGVEEDMGSMGRGQVAN